MRLQAKFWPNVYYKAKIICFDPAPLLSIRIICSCLIIILGCFKTPQLQKTLWLAGHPLVCSDPLRNVEPITQTVWDTFRKTRVGCAQNDSRTNTFFCVLAVCSVCVPALLIVYFYDGHDDKTSNIIESKVISSTLLCLLGDTYLIRTQSPTFTAFSTYLN